MGRAISSYQDSKLNKVTLVTSFKPITLNQDVDDQVLGIVREMYAAVPLPKMVERLGGVDWLLAITKLVLEKMSLSQKLSLILRGNQALLALTDRLAKIWLENTYGEERETLEAALIQAKLLYRSDLHKT